MADRTRAHVFISGIVQGVSFRANTRRKARSLGIDGWVKNLDDGRVEAVFEGPADAVDSIIEWCHEGPSRARVEDIEVREETPEDVHGFQIRY